MNYITITHPDINNGLGCRVTLWIAGCSHHCKGCHNPETWEYNQGNPLEEAYTEISKALSKPYIKGLTLSGGDPLSQSDASLKELYEFLLRIKHDFPGKDIWIYAGDYYEEAIQNEYKKKILDLCDYMVEGPYVCQQRDLSLAFRGSRNQNIVKLK